MSCSSSLVNAQLPDASGAAADSEGVGSNVICLLLFSADSGGKQRGYIRPEENRKQRYSILNGIHLH